MPLCVCVCVCVCVCIYICVCVSELYIKNHESMWVPPILIQYYRLDFILLPSFFLSL